MITREEILERSFWAALMKVAIARGNTLNYELYQPISLENKARYDHDKSLIPKYVEIFGVGNNQSRGPKHVPRITVDIQAYYPGELGIEPITIDREENEVDYSMYENSYEVKASIIDIHLVCNLAEDMRLLHQIMYEALPARGYIAPFTQANLSEYIHSKLGKTGNIYMEVGNFYDHTDTDHGLLEKVYSYNITEAILTEKLVDSHIKPISEITAILNDSLEFKVTE